MLRSWASQGQLRCWPPHLNTSPGVDGQDERTAALRELIDAAIAERRGTSLPPTVDAADVRLPIPAATLPPAVNASDTLASECEDLNPCAAEGDRAAEEDQTEELTAAAAEKTETLPPFGRA